MADIYHLTGSTLHRWKTLRVCSGMLHQCCLRSQQMTALLAAASWCWVQPCAPHSSSVWLYKMSHLSVKWSLAAPGGCLLYSFTLIHWLQNSTWLASSPSLISHRCNCGWPDHVCKDSSLTCHHSPSQFHFQSSTILDGQLHFQSIGIIGITFYALIAPQTYLVKISPV